MLVRAAERWKSIKLTELERHRATHVVATTRLDMQKSAKLADAECLFW